jgi:hypothetical protein
LLLRRNRGFEHEHEHDFEHEYENGNWELFPRMLEALKKRCTGSVQIHSSSPVIFATRQFASGKTQNPFQLDIRRKSRIVSEWHHGGRFPETAAGLQPNTAGQPCRTL